jgi:hypothetical protein
MELNFFLLTLGRHSVVARPFPSTEYGSLLGATMAMERIFASVKCLAVPAKRPGVEYFKGRLLRGLD